jgi:hypothetical protein
MSDESKGSEGLTDSDYVVMTMKGSKVTAACGFGWCGPPGDEEDLEDVAQPARCGDSGRVEPVNPHHPRYLGSKTGKGRASLPVSVAEGPDERDYGSSDSGDDVVGGSGSVVERYVSEPRRPLESVESIHAQMQRMRALREREPQYAEAIMLQGLTLVDFAAKGAIVRIMEIVQNSEPGELLYYHTAKMFMAACKAGKVDVVRHVLLRWD